jgi:putative tricarboxylic transport membrane protein
VKANKGNLIAGACLAAFGIYVIFVASKLPYVSEVGPGPGFFPLWLGIGLIVFSSCLMLSSFSAFTKESASDSTTWEASGRALAGWFGLMVATALFGWIGFSASFVILTVFLIVALDRRPFLLSLGVGIGLAVAFHLLFVIALDVSLPAGRWGF